MNEAKRKLIMEQYRLKHSDIIKDEVPKEFLERKFINSNKIDKVNL